jgi:hypothetical protein
MTTSFRLEGDLTRSKTRIPKAAGASAEHQCSVQVSRLDARDTDSTLKRVYLPLIGAEAIFKDNQGTVVACYCDHVWNVSVQCL